MSYEQHLGSINPTPYLFSIKGNPMGLPFLISCIFKLLYLIL